MSALAHGAGWRIDDAVCDSGPADRPFEERHEGVCIAAVVSGTFQYRTVDSVATLVPGALLLGSHGRCFACSHEHGTGDRCVAFTYEPALFEAIVRDVPGARRFSFAIPRLPPMTASLPLIVAARDRRTPGALEELAYRLAGFAVMQASDLRPRPAAVSLRDRRRISETVRRIEADSAGGTSLMRMAREAAMSPYHFLCIFRAVTGTTPYRFVLDQRLRDVARRLATTNETVTAAALDAGFHDISEFNRRFRRVLGVTPGAYRKERRGGRFGL